MEIRQARSADLPHLPAIELSAAEAFRGLDVPERIFEEFTPADAWSARQQAGTLWVAQGDDGRLHAFLAATRHGRRLHIDEFAVALDQQGRGLGRRMLAHAIDAARQAGLRRLSLTTFRGVPWNAPFYASAGFRPWDDPPRALGAALAGEARRGLKDRCAMVLELKHP
jgi:GNAT superfamily N-acetyltransferase